MLFNSYHFLIFFPVVTIGFFLLGHRFRWAWLLAASCYFYAAFIPVYILILFFTILVDYAAGILIENSQGKRRKMMLVLSLIANIGVLAFFKYYNFAAANIDALAAAIGWNYSVPLLGIILPIGLSFHTFQSMSYTIEVYRGNQKAERHLGIFALYVMFYPQLVAGPIERPQNLLHQFHEPKYFDYTQAVSGLRLMAWGFFKKIVIADSLAYFVNIFYGAPRDHAGLPLLVGTVFFAYQIYCDFSGYSDIARGSARVMGFHLMKNFDSPYLARSVAEFWSRWHISLSTWFKDYVYIPLGGNRVATPRLCFNLMVTFLLSGLWHGANWTYVVWGGLNGLYLLSAVLTTNFRPLEKFPRFGAALSTLSVFCLISFSWIFFRAASLSDALYIINHLFSDAGQWISQLSDSSYLKSHLYMGEGRKFRVALISIFVLQLIEYINRRRPLAVEFAARPLVLRWVVYVVLAIVVLNSGAVSELPFIYFQF